MTSSIHTRLILASGSPYRRELLERLGLPFEVIVPTIDETPHPAEKPHETALRLAKEKALAVAADNPGSLVIGSDQVATLGDAQIGKPGTHENALTQLLTMRGRRVTFHTAVCVCDSRLPPFTTQAENVQTYVTFRNLPEAELDAYLKKEQPYDCAGSARNEALGIILLEKIESTDPTALTGLPLITVTTMLRNCGISFF